jgi:hypothetical protein
MVALTSCFVRPPRRIPQFDPKLVANHPHSSSQLDRSSLIVPPARPKTAMRNAAERLRKFRPEEK